MRYLFGLLCVCALGLLPLVGCSETTGDGGSGGTAGDGGSGGTAGTGGMAGTGGSAGSGGAAGDGGSGGNGGSAGTGGMGGDGGTGGMGGDGGTGGMGGGAITVACGENLTEEVRILPFDLQVEPGPIAAGSPFTAELTGVARFPEFVLDVLNDWVCGGVRTIWVIDLAATVSVRSGATGADVELGIDVAALSPGPTRFCNFPAEQVCTADSECLGGTCDPTRLLQDIPVVDGIPLSPGGCEPDTRSCPSELPPLVDCDCSACAALDTPPSTTKLDQCTANGFCLNGDLPLPLEKRTGSYIADPASGTPILFGWFDGNPPVTNPDGTMQLPEASFTLPVPPIGIRVDAAGLAVPLQCLMGVDSGGPYGVGVPDKASPTPDSLLVTFLVP